MRSTEPVPYGSSTQPLSVVPADRTTPVLDVTVGDVLRQAAAEVPHAVALTDGSDTARRWTYAQLLVDAEAIARGLLRHLTPGDRVVVLSASCPEFVVAEFALALAGLVMVTANPASTETELEYVLKTSSASTMVVGRGLKGADLEPMARAVAGPGYSVLVLDDLPRAVDGSPLPDVSPDDPVQIQFTSGTTGWPKGAMLRHRSVANVPRFYALRSQIKGPGGWLNPFPLFHTGGCVTGTLAPVWLRLNHVLLPAFDPQLMLRLLAEEQVVGGIMVPTMAHRMLSVSEFARYDLSALQHVGIGAAPVAPEQIRQLEQAFGCHFANTFGQTEAAPIISSTHIDDPADVKALSVGRPLPQQELKIADDHGRPVFLGDVGEICIRGYQVMIGYDGMPEQTAETVDSDGFLHTGDLGHLDEHGNLYLDGRKKDMLIRGGENIYPVEIELRLVDHPAVVSAVVIGRPDAEWGELVEAVIVPADPSAPPPAAELMAWCRETLHGFKVPTGWYLADELPTLASGKIPKHRVVEERARDAYRPLQ